MTMDSNTTWHGMGKTSTKFKFDSKAGVDLAGVSGRNETDENGNPAGGWAQSGHPRDGDFLHVRWQDGPVDREGGQLPNGTFVEDVIEVARLRLEFYQKSSFACSENQEAHDHLAKALEALESRRRDRRERKVEGKHEK